MERRRLWLPVCLFCLLVLLISACGQAQTSVPTAKPTTSPAAKSTAAPAPSPKPASTGVAAAFAGKTITVIIPTTAGSGQDITGRVYAKYLTKYLPGNPAIVVRNMVGGAQTIAGNYMYNSKPDGLTLGIASGTFQLNYIMGLKAVQYDLQKMDAIIGNAGGNFYYTRPNIVAKAEDLPKADGIIFGHSTGMPAQIFIAIVNLIGFQPKKVVTGYGGGSDARRGFLAGEINMTAEGLEELVTALAPYIAKGEVIAILQSGILDEKGELVVDPGAPVGILTVKEAYERIHGKPPSGMAWDAFRAQVAATRSYQNVLVTPPGVPAAIMAAYWDAAAKMLKDTEFRKVIDPLVGEKSPWGAGEAYSKRFKANMKMDPKVRDWLAAALAKYGIVFE